MPQRPKTIPRIRGIDICRSVAILLAMFSHALVEARALDGVSETVSVPIRFVLQMAPPIFIILFGTMLEIVYKTRFEQGRAVQATSRLLTRALQCYLLYVVTILSMLAAGHATPGYALRCILMMGVTPYADILKFYTLALAFAPALLIFRIRWGLVPLVAMSLLIHLAHPLIAAVPAPPLIGEKDFAGPVLGFLAGMATQDVGGPSVLHGMSFVIWGMMAGRAIHWMMYGETRDLKRRGKMVLMIMGVMSAAITLRLWNWDAPLDVFRGIASLSIRNANMPLYFALGCGVTVMAVAACLWLYDRKGLTFGQSATFAGRTSLFTFSFGNVLLYLAPNPALSPVQSWAYALFLFAAICVQSYVFWKVQTPKDSERQSLPGAMLGRLISYMNARTAALTQAPAELYVRWLEPAGPQAMPAASRS